MALLVREQGCGVPSPAADVDDRRPPGDQAGPRPWTRAGVAAVAALTILGLVLRLHQLSSQSLWLDEGLSAWIAEKDLPETLRWLIRADTHPPLYVGSLHFWTGVSDSVFWIRMFSVTASTLTIPVVCLLGRCLYDTRVALLAGSFVAVSPFAVRWGQNARPYALLGLLAMLANYGLVRTLQSPTRASRVLYFLSVAALLYTHNIGGWIVALTHVIILWPLRLSGKAGATAGLRCVVGGLLAWAAWLPALVSQVRGGGAHWLRNPSASDMRELVVSFVSQGLPAAPSTAVVALLLVLAGGLVILGLLARRGHTVTMLIVVALLVGPVVLELDAAVIQSVFLDRTLIPVSIVFLLVLAAGLASLTRTAPGKAAAAALATLIVLSNATSLHQYYDLGDGQDVNERWDLAASYVAARQSTPGDAILFKANTSQLPFDYYYRRTAATALPRFGVPCSLEACYRPEAHTTDDDKLRLGKELEPYERIWVVKRWWGNWDFSLDDALGDRAAAVFERADVRDVGGVVVELYVHTERGPGARAP